MIFHQIRSQRNRKPKRSFNFSPAEKLKRFANFNFRSAQEVPLTNANYEAIKAEEAKSFVLRVGADVCGAIFEKSLITTSPNSTPQFALIKALSSSPPLRATS
jgi:hypothetical protein